MNDCETCRFWHGITNYDGLCRRFAPRCEMRGNFHHVPMSDDDYNTAEWPGTKADDWCGEHQPKPKETT